MADNDRPDDLDDEEKPVEETPKKKKKWLLWLAILIVLAGISVAATLYMLGTFDQAEPVAEDEAAEPADSNAAEVVATIYYPLKPEFMTNFDVRGRQRFLQVEMSLMLRENDVITAIELHMPAIRNELVMLLRGQVYEEMQTPEGKELLRQQALLAVQRVLQAEIGKPGVEQVLFTNLVMQ